MNSSCGFTKHGIEKIGNSIKVYMYLILSSRQAARHGIIWDGAQAAAAQEIFVDNLENVINREVSLEDDIAWFPNVLKYARSELDYSGLQVIEGYNNKIVVNTGGAELGSLCLYRSMLFQTLLCQNLLCQNLWYNVVYTHLTIIKMRFKLLY